MSLESPNFKIFWQKLLERVEWTPQFFHEQIWDDPWDFLSKIVTNLRWRTKIFFQKTKIGLKVRTFKTESVLKVLTSRLPFWASLEVRIFKYTQLSYSMNEVVSDTGTQDEGERERNRGRERERERDS